MTRTKKASKECWARVIGKCTPFPGQCATCPFFTPAASLGLTPEDSAKAKPVELTLTPAAFTDTPAQPVSAK